MPPLVNTEFSAEVDRRDGIPASLVADELFKAFERNDYEVHIADTADLYQLYLSSPEEALRAINRLG